MLNLLRPAVVLILCMTALTGLAYPLAMTGLAQGGMPERANGSLLLHKGAPIGSALVGQGFASAGYLHPRPSAVDYAAMPSGASNLGPTSAALMSAVNTRRSDWAAENTGAAPIDALTASGSGLDPHVSPRNAQGQAARIAQARGADSQDVLDLIGAQTEGRWLGIYGEPRVNVLAFNMALDAAWPMAASGTK